MPWCPSASWAPATLGDRWRSSLSERTVVPPLRTVLPFRVTPALMPLRSQLSQVAAGVMHVHAGFGMMEANAAGWKDGPGQADDGTAARA